MKRGTTVSGFAFEFDECVLDDMRFVDVLAEIVDPDVSDVATLSATSKLAAMLLGKEQKKKLYDHIGAKHGGRVPVAELSAEVFEIIRANGKDAEKN